MSTPVSMGMRFHLSRSFVPFLGRLKAQSMNQGCKAKPHPDLPEEQDLVSFRATDVDHAGLKVGPPSVLANHSPFGGVVSQHFHLLMDFDHVWRAISARPGAWRKDGERAPRPFPIQKTTNATKDSAKASFITSLRLFLIRHNIYACTPNQTREETRYEPDRRHHQ